MATAVSTPERILDASLRLFNEHGFHNVAALRIAMHLGMSPGHLAYHFKTKDDIVMALFPRIEEELDRDIWDTKKPGQPMSARDGAIQQVEIFRSLWRYRFVFNAMSRFMARDSELRPRYERMRDRILGSIQGIFDDLIERGDMRQIPPPNSTQLIAKSIWMIYLSWLRLEQLDYPHRETPRNAAILAGVMQNFTILQSHLDPALAAEMVSELQKALPLEADEAGDAPAKAAAPAAAKKSQTRSRRAGAIKPAQA